MADIKKIFPFLSNVDFSSSKTKRNLILGGVFSALLIVLVVASSGQEQTAEPQERQDPQPKSRSSLTVPEGENNDVTASSQRTIQARNRLRRQGGADIYAQGVDGVSVVSAFSKAPDPGAVARGFAAARAASAGSAS